MKYIADTTEFQITEPTIVTLGKFDGRHGPSEASACHEGFKRQNRLGYSHFHFFHCTWQL